MNGILNVPDKEISFILDDLTIDRYTPIQEVFNTTSPNMVEFQSGGEPITLITNNMPGDLKEEITTLIKKHCNH